MRHYLIKLVLTIGFAFLAFAPSNISSRIFSSGKPSHLWVRLAGIVGLAYLALGLIADGKVSFIQLTQQGTSLALALQHTGCGFVIGLLIALSTKKFESGE